jgi:arylsulfatase A-like enzyme
MWRLLTYVWLSLVTLDASERPNVVVLLADDAGWGDYSCNGNRQVATPHIDSLARDGARFERFFVQPVCSPTRAEFLTGRYHPRLGVTGVSLGQERMDAAEKTFADSFKAAGYVTGIFGKWHNGSQWPYHPLARGFDTFWGYTSGHWGEYFDAPLEHNGVMVPTKGYIVDTLTDKALQFIERNQNKPFLCFIPFTTPHSPFSVPPQDWERFKERTLTQTATVAKDEDPAATRCVLAMLENQDRNVGRVLAKLKALGLERETIVVYFSDNGPNTARWNDGMKGKKGSTDEGGVRSPLLIRWPPKITPGSKVEAIAAAIDLCPTLLACAQVPRLGDRPLDGRSLTPLLFNETSAVWPMRTLFQTWGKKVSVRTDTYRLDQAGNLFDMVADPGQKTPIQARQPAMAQSLQRAAQTWREEMGLSSDATGPRGTSTSQAKGNGIDPRPIAVGYREFPTTMLPARDGEPHGGLRRSAAAPNASYFTHWTQTSDSATWNVEVINAGMYVVTLDYTCPPRDVGATLELSFGSTRLSGKITEGWDPPLYTDQDVVPRTTHGESLLKPFKTMTLGEIRLEAGQNILRLRATAIPGQCAMDLRRLTLTLR